MFCQKYWQQKVDYTISVELDDVNHYLKANETFVYTNNSPNDLNEIYIHLWPNAYKNEKTALAKQQYKNGKKILFYGDKDEVRGWIDSLNFTNQGMPLDWNYDSDHQDIAIIKLKTPLKSGSSIEISTPFRIKIPSGSVSRLGHIDQSYQITQWYPKPAVYDKNGWNAMPYLNQGEFYSEYGSFDVSITLPKNYVVGATGDLVNGEKEIAWLEKKVSETKLLFKEDKIGGWRKDGMDFPESSKEFKTLHYHQENVHDFAWFTDKRYYVLKGEVELPHSKKKVTTWAMFTNNEAKLWEKSIEYLNDATYYYSLWNGDYPYNHVTAVDGTISAGGGMEYPNITVIGNAGTAIQLEVVIVHEVGHNWFYGILGSNERKHGWMDEGLNTLNEIRYIQTKYPENSSFSDMFRGEFFHLENLSHHDMADYSCHFMTHLGEDQPIETHSEEFSSINYGIIMYQKTGLVFYYLKDYLGDELFDQCMKEYYQTWKYKHPQPEDIKEVFTSITNKNLDWIFEDLIKTTKHLDFKIGKVKRYLTNRKQIEYRVDIINKGQIKAPVEIGIWKQDSLLKRIWSEPFIGKTNISFDDIDFDHISIDPGNDIPEINRQNNYWKSKGLFKRLEPIKLEFLIGDQEANQTNLFWLPVMGWNSYDKFMIGLGIHNLSIPGKPFQYLVAPMYSFGRKFISGSAEFSYTFLPERNFKNSRFGLSVKSYKFDTISNNNSYFIGLSPYWIAKIKNKSNSSAFSKWIKIQGLFRQDTSKTNVLHTGGFITYSLDYSKPNHKIFSTLRFDYIQSLNSGDKVARAHITSEYRYKYLKRKMNRWISVRGFLGNTFLYKNNKGIAHQYYQMSLSGANGMQDVFLEGYYFFRSDNNSILRSGNWGGFNSNSNFGTTSFWMASLNGYIQMPIKPNIFGAFIDYGAFYDGYSIQSGYNLGLGIRLGEAIGIYIPLYRSSNMGELYTKNYAKEIRLTLKFNIVNSPFIGNLL